MIEKGFWQYVFLGQIIEKTGITSQKEMITLKRKLFSESTALGWGRRIHMVVIYLRNCCAEETLTLFMPQLGLRPMKRNHITLDFCSK